MSEITVITLTRYRPKEVQRAILSVQNQTERVAQHLVLVDGDEKIEASIQEFIKTNRIERCTVRLVPRSENDFNGPGRSSVLRNLGVQMAKTAWIAYLDDDNQWQPHHLSSLKTLAEQIDSPAVYSEVTLLTVDGQPYLEQEWPWANDREEAAKKYWEYVEKGVLVPGVNVIHDKPDVRDVPVDTSAWLLSRELLLEIPFQESFSTQDAETLTSEDDKLFYALLKRKVNLACTHQPTLLYYLGGYSNSLETVWTDEPIEWATTR